MSGQSPQNREDVGKNAEKCRKTAFSLGFLVFSLVFLVFSPSIFYELVDLDDVVYVSNNTMLHGGLTVESVRAAFSLKNATATMYMPLLWVSYMADVDLFGASAASPWGFHLTNVLLHSLNAVLLFGILLHVAKRPWPALFFALLWAVHPLRVESVAWVTERKDVLSGFFGLLSVGAYLWSNYFGQNEKSAGRWLAWVISLLCFTMALLVKPALAPLPLVLLLLDGWADATRSPPSPFCWKRLARQGAAKTPFFIVAGLAALGTVLTHDAVSGAIQFRWAGQAMLVPINYGFYLLKWLLPVGLTPMVPEWGIWLSAGQAGWAALLGGFAVLALTWAAWSGRKKFPLVWPGWLWFLVMLLPVSGIRPIPLNDVADRFTYFPAMGFSVALLGLWGLLGRSRAVRLRTIVATGMVVVLAVLTLRQLPTWKNADAMTRRVLSVYPDHAVALTEHAGRVIRRTGNFAHAAELLERALASHPLYWKAHLMRAQCVWALEGADAALRSLEALPLPTSQHALSEWHRDQARYALMTREYDAALHHAEQSLALIPQDSTARFPLLLLAMTIAHEQGGTALALATARRFTPYAGKERLDPTDLLPHYVFQWVAGYREDTWRYFQRMRETFPDRPDLLNNMVWALATADWSPVDPQTTVEWAEELAAQFPAPHPGILDTLAAAQANADDFSSAVRTMETALAQFPAQMDEELAAFHGRLASRLTLYQQQQPYREAALERMYGLHAVTAATSNPAQAP